MIKNTSFSRILSILNVTQKLNNPQNDTRVSTSKQFDAFIRFRAYKKSTLKSYLKFFRKNLNLYNFFTRKKSVLKLQKKGLSFLVASFYSSQLRLSLSNQNLVLVKSLTGRRSLLNYSIFKKGLKKSLKAYRCVVLDLDKVIKTKTAAIMHTNKLRMPLKKFFGLFYSFDRGRFLKKKLNILYLIVSPKQPYCLRKKKRLRRIRKRLRKRILKSFKQVPY